MGRRSGFSLVEVLLAVVIVSVLSLMAYPRVNSAMTKSNLRGARTRLTNMFAAARAAATQNSRTGAFVRFNGNTAVVTAAPRRSAPVGANTEDTLGAVVNLNTVYGATLATNGVTNVAYDPRGMATGFNAGGTWIKVSKGSYADSLKIDKLGRVTK
jgi:prepilin-type N-terminal cleavage/methylation domain-containing protein